MASGSSAPKTDTKGPKINVKAEYCPEAVVEWYRLTSLKDRKESLRRKDLALKAKQHLVFLNWVFWHVNKKGKWELRYTSPVNGKNYISLRKACASCIEHGGCSTIHSSTTISLSPKRQIDSGEINESTFDKDSEAFSSISPQKCNVTTISEDGACSTIHSSTTAQPPSTTIPSSPQHFGEIDQSIPDDNFEAFSSISLEKYNVTTISEDGGCSIIHSSTTMQPPSTTIPSSSQHFGEIDQSIPNDNFEAFSSISLEKYNVTTISEDGGCSIIHSSTTAQPPSTTIPSSPLNLKPPSTTIPSSPLNLKKRPRDFGEIDQSTFNEDSEVFSLFSLQNCNATTISTSKVNEKHVSTSNSEVSDSLRCNKRRKVSNMSIMEKNLEGCDQNEKVLNTSILENNSEVFGKREEALKMSIREGCTFGCDQNEKVLNTSILENNSEVFGKKEEALKMSIRERCTFVSWLVKNRVLVPGTNVFCRGSNNIVKIGSIHFDGIICDCCQDNFNIIGFETHAGCIRNSPYTSIMLEDGRSLLECQREALNLSF